MIKPFLRLQYIKYWLKLMRPWRPDEVPVYLKQISDYHDKHGRRGRQ